MRREILRLEQVYLFRKGVNILEDFKLNIFQGEFLLLFGTYGGGMKELADFLSGREVFTSGRVYVNEAKLNPKEALNPEKLGIYVISDGEQLFPYLSVAENIFLSWKKNIFSFTLPVEKVNLEAELILKKLGVDISAKKMVSEVSNIDQQIIKLAKAYCRSAKLIVMNDIADIYTPSELHKLFFVLKFLQSKGISILWITGRCINVVKQIDRLVVIRHGKNIKTYFAPVTDIGTINRIASGSNYIKLAGWIGEKKKQELLKVEMDWQKESYSLVVNKGECVGVVFEDATALEKFSKVMLGKKVASNVKIWLNNEEYAPSSYQKAIRKGVCQIEMLNIHKNLFQNLSVEENLAITSMKNTSKWKLFVNKKYNNFISMKFKERYKVHSEKNITLCSWKEQEKILFTRLKENNTKLIVATEFLANVDYARWEGLIDSIQEILNQNKSFLLLSVNEGDLKYVCNRVYTYHDMKIELCNES